MGRYTITVKELCYILSNDDTLTPEAAIAKAVPKIFDFDFPFYDEKERNNFEVKFLRHFYTREIGLETFELWKLRLSEKLNLEMPFYNSLYRSTLLDFDPLADVDVYTTHTGNIKAVGNSVNNSGSKNLFNDTPQNGLSDVESGKYLTSASVNSGRSEDVQSNNTDESYTHRVRGKQGTGSFSTMLQAYRKTIINVDSQVFKALEPLFMQVW